MKNDLQKRFLETVQRHGMVRPGDRIGLGVSGGADSVAMLRIFGELQARLGIALRVLHFHHQLRGAAADEDEEFVASLAAKLGLEFESGRGDVALEARLHGWNIEDAARRMRYAYFASVAESRSLARVAVAHTASDQAETVLSHLLRGTGLTGLAGIYPVSGAIIRPLLDVQREEVRAFLSALKQPWREDASNTDASRTRARIRHQLIPLLERDFAAHTVPRLARLAKHAREDEAFWSYIEEEWFLSLARRESSGAISLSIADLLQPLPRFERAKHAVPPTARTAAMPLPTIALTRRLVRRIFAEIRGGSRAQLTSRHVDAVIDLATRSQSGARLNLPGVGVERIFDRLSFTLAAARSAVVGKGERADKGIEFAYTVSRPERAQPASVVVPEIQRRFNLKMVDWPSSRSDTVVGWGALDFDRVHWPLVLRNWRSGDSFRPHGSRRIRKLKRLLLESRVPRGMRGAWPVLTSEGKVVWASGYPVAQEFAADQGTRIGLVIGEEALLESA